MRTLLPVLLCLAAMTASAQATMIDKFDEGLAPPNGIYFPGILILPGGSPITTVETGLDPYSVIGGARQTTLTHLGGTSSTSVGVFAGSGVLLSVGPSTTAQLELEYLEAAGGTGGADLLESRNDRLRLLYGFADLQALVQISIEDSDGTAASQMMNSPFGGAFAIPVKLDFLFSNFVIDQPGGTAGINWSSIDQIKLTLNHTPAMDHRISTFESVPDPTTMAILAVGALGLISRRRKVRPV